MGLSCAAATVDVFVSGAVSGVGAGIAKKRGIGGLHEMIENLLPVIVPAISLRQLRVEVDEVTGEEEVVLWLYS